jgi:hypothetical protein
MRGILFEKVIQHLQRFSQLQDFSGATLRVIQRHGALFVGPD